MTDNSANIKSIGFALDPRNIPTFLLDWELTRLCNLDCTYCTEDGHDNSTKHPPLNECLQSIDFMYEYVNEYMKYKKETQRKATLNVYGGESLFHPDIVQILRECHERYKPYSDQWELSITCTTNAIVGARRWTEIVPLVDEFTVSYHAETLPKQKQQYLDNILYLKEQGKRFKCIVMMHNQPKLFEDAQTIVEFCKENNLRFMAKPLDNVGPEWAYTPEQFAQITERPLQFVKSVNSINEGRSCCGGRRLSLNGDLKSNVGFVHKQGFEGWSCSVNWFFLFVRQFDGTVYTNKDCQMSTTGRVEPLGNIKDSKQIISTIKRQFETNNMPIIRCRKDICRCGFCAPKAEQELDFRELIKRNVPVDVFQK
jgi:MoaA/NifB/PqqE/SkfB family radical SAM enzyme